MCQIGHVYVLQWNDLTDFIFVHLCWPSYFLYLSLRNVAYFTCPLTIPHNYFGGERVTWLRAGWTHCVVGVASGAVYSWGRADYGQLGTLEDEKDDSSSDTTPSEVLRKRCR